MKGTVSRWEKAPMLGPMEVAPPFAPGSLRGLVPAAGCVAAMAVRLLGDEAALRAEPDGCAGCMERVRCRLCRGLS